MTFEQRLEGSRGNSMGAEGTASAKVLEWEACLLCHTNGGQVAVKQGKVCQGERSRKVAKIIRGTCDQRNESYPR